MINFTFLNWKFDNYLYSTEVIETPVVLELISKIDTLIKTYGVSEINPVSDIFWKSDRKLDFQEIKAFLQVSVMNCRIEEDRDLVAYQRLLGSELRHGPEITKELSDILQSVIDGGGMYDHIRLIDDFLKNPYSGVSFAAINSIREARNALNSTKRSDDCFEGRPLKVEDFLKDIGIDTDGIDNEILEKKLRVFIDDGMGYGAKNGDCFAVENNSDEIRLWM